MKRSCRGCLFYDCCDEKVMCKHYAPIDENEETPEEHIEEKENRRAYYNAWIEYAARDGDDCFRPAKHNKT